MDEAIKEPTSEQCQSDSIFGLNGEMYLATWYPQMGGYCGKCLIHLSKTTCNDCFECYVWHDGSFPFGSDYPPANLHHCDPAQFIKFGELVAKAKCIVAARETVELGIMECKNGREIFTEHSIRERDMPDGKWKITATRID